MARTNSAKVASSWVGGCTLFPSVGPAATGTPGISGHSTGATAPAANDATRSQQW
jgi:hypothetical protein